jgi:hypothetical protein
MAAPIDEPWTAVRAFTLCQYDPGNAVYRYHSAANTAPGGLSAFARWGHDNPYCDLRQYDGERDRETCDTLYRSADVVHVHMNYELLDREYRSGLRANHLLVRHYHGSVHPTAKTIPPIVQNEIDDAIGAVQIGARLYHQRFSARMHWLPIPVPVDDYRAVAAQHHTPRAGRRFRLAHSPTHRPVKGTTALEYVVSDLQVKGVPIDLVMIQNRSHALALALKATCDATFDSFWLGIQGSGLEAAAMGQAVIAGDTDVLAEYEASDVGRCPYTFADTVAELGRVLERLAVDDEFYAREASRVHEYVRDFHDYPAVGARYWRILRDERAARGFDGAE